MALLTLWALLFAGLSSVDALDDICPPGTYFNGTVCTPCPVGTYQPESTSTRRPGGCETCPSGSYCSRAGLAAAEGACRAGYYCPQGSTSASSLLCPADSYCTQGSKAPTACPAGRRSSPGATSSSQCTTTSQNICPPGQYLYGSYRCYDCPSGTFQPTWVSSGDANSCQPCPPGYYCASTRLAAPTGACLVAGYYCTTRATSATGNKCPTGFYCPPMSETPASCPPGTSSQPGAEAISNCKKVSISCPPGMYRNGSQCGDCPVGTYQPTTTSLGITSACQPCDAGRYCMYPKARAVTGSCTAGYYCPPGSALPTSRLCPKNHYCSTGSGSPLKCPARSTSGKGQFSCRTKDKNCGPGTYTDSSNQCKMCPVGSYQPGSSKGTKGSHICLPCEAGWYCDTTGLAAPSGRCALGYYCPLSSTKPTQHLCPFGHYCPGGGSTPVRCPQGTTSTPGSTSRAECTTNGTVECPAGYYIQEMQCTPCPEGTYKSTTTGAACTACTAGRYCSGLGNTAATGYCTAGYYCPSGSNSSTAILCPENHYCTRGVGYATRCYSSYKSYPGSTSSSSCSAYVPAMCDVGHYNNRGTCSPCRAGYFKPEADRSGVESCLQCPAGFYCNQTGSAEPTGLCTAGYFCPVTSISPSTITCPADHYCPEGSPAPVPCPAGRRAPPGSASCRA